jgi:hypothetical protein
MITIEKARQLRAIIERGVIGLDLSPAEALTAVELYPPWTPEEKAYQTGERVQYGGRLYEVIANHTSNAAYPVETTFAYYRLIELEHEGTLDDPIPYPETAGIVVNVVSGKYYAYKGEVYLAKAVMPACVYPPDTAGMWQWERVI